MMISLLFDSAFLGFAWYSILLLFNSLFTKGPNRILTQTIDTSVIYLVKYSGLLFFVYWTFYIVNSFIGFEQGGLINRMFGPYWFEFWIYPFAYIILTQLFWIRQITTNKAVRLLIAFILLLTLSIEKLIIIITFLYRDYLPSSWILMNQESMVSIVSNWFLKLLIFSMLVSIITFLLNRRPHSSSIRQSENAD